MSNVSFEGLFIPHVTPFTESGQVDADSLKRLTQYFVGIDGVSGLVSCARIGEGPVLRDEEKYAVFQSVGEVARAAHKTHIATISPQSTDEAIDMVRRLERLPVDAAMIFPPLLLAWGKVPSKTRVQFFQDVAQSTNLPLVLFQVPVQSYWYTADEVCQIAAIPNVVAYKEASFNMLLFSDTMAALQKRGASMKVLTGNDRFVAQSYLFGANGALIGIANVATHLWAALDRAGRSGDYATALKVQDQLTEIKELVFAEPIVEAVSRIKAILHDQGLIASTFVRRPQLGIDDGERDELLQRYRELSAAAR